MDPVTIGTFLLPLLSAGASMLGNGQEAEGGGDTDPIARFLSSMLGGATSGLGGITGGASDASQGLAGILSPLGGIQGAGGFGSNFNQFASGLDTLTSMGTRRAAARSQRRLNDQLKVTEKERSRGKEFGRKIGTQALGLNYDGRPKGPVAQWAIEQGLIPNRKSGGAQGFNTDFLSTFF